MAENLIDLRRRIGSVKNTQKITRAMKTVSAVKLKKRVIEINRARPVQEHIKHLLYTVIRSGLNMDNPLLKKGAGSEKIFVVLSSDKGLCGSFNTQIIKRFEDLFEKYSSAGSNLSVVTIGKKADIYFKKKGFQVRKNFPDIMKSFIYEDAIQVSEYLSDLYINGNVSEINILYTEFENASRQQIREEKFLPLILGYETESTENVEYIFEPEPDKIFDALLPKYINLKIFLTMLGSAASEYAARMVAMELATQNAMEMIKNLTLTMNKLRQASITKELLEIITATEALTK